MEFNERSKEHFPKFINYKMIFMKTEFLDFKTTAGFMRITVFDNKLKNLSWIKRIKYLHTKNPLLLKTKKEIMEYFSGKRKSFTLPIETDGTKFQKRVWSECKKIPYGKVITYKELALLSGSPKAMRAVGSVMARNRLPIIIPCHRVIASNNKMGGYSGGCGISTKIKLLSIEGIKNI